jgi:hypothetical protein
LTVVLNLFQDLLLCLLIICEGLVFNHQVDQEMLKQVQHDRVVFERHPGFISGSPVLLTHHLQVD